MRIAIVSNLYPPHYLGGYEVHCAQVAEALKRMGHEVRVLTSTYGMPASNEGRSHLAQHDVNGVPVSRWLNQYYFEPQPKWDRPWMFWRAKRELQDCDKFVKFVEEFRPDVVNWWNMNGMTKVLLPLPGRWGIPDVHAVDDLWLVYDYGQGGKQSAAFWQQFWSGHWGPMLLRPVLRPIVALWERRVCAYGITTRDLSHHPSQVCFLSEYLRKVHRDAGMDFPSSRVIHGGVDKNRFFQALPKPADATGRLRLLYAGQVTPDRGLLTVIDALGEIPESTRRRMTLTVVGGGPPAYLSTVTARIKELGVQDHISILGKVSHDRIPDVFKAHDVFIFASKRPEGLGFVCIEAMLAGCAVVTTGSGGSKEIAEAADLPMFPPENPRALSVLLARLEAQRDQVSEIALRGQRVAVRQFSLDRMMEDWQQVFEELGSRRNNVAGRHLSGSLVASGSAVCSPPVGE